MNRGMDLWRISGGCWRGEGLISSHLSPVSSHVVRLCGLYFYTPRDVQHASYFVSQQHTGVLSAEDSSQMVAFSTSYRKMFSPSYGRSLGCANLAEREAILTSNCCDNDTATEKPLVGYVRDKT